MARVYLSYLEPTLLVGLLVRTESVATVLPEGNALHVCFPTKSGSRVNAVGEEHQQMWHMLNAHRCVLLGKEFGA